MKYYIFRHSETFFSKYHIPYGPFQDSARILSKGIPTTRRLASYLKAIPTDAYFSSPYLRCRQTVEIIEKEAGVKFTVDPRLAEEMITHGQESFEALEKRISSFIAEIKAKNYQTVAVCSHGWPIACLVALVTKGKATRKDLDLYPNPGVLFCIEGKKMKEINFNKE